MTHSFSTRSCSCEVWTILQHNQLHIPTCTCPHIHVCMALVPIPQIILSTCSQSCTMPPEPTSHQMILSQSDFLNEFMLYTMTGPFCLTFTYYCVTISPSLSDKHTYILTHGQLTTTLTWACTSFACPTQDKHASQSQTLEIQSSSAVQDIHDNTISTLPVHLQCKERHAIQTAGNCM